MPNKGKRLPKPRIRDNYTYSLDQIADLFGVEKSTVTRWIRDDGLKRLPKARPYLVHSIDLKQFMQKRQSKHKKPCQAHELYCCKCKTPQMPRKRSGTATKKPNGSVLFSGHCCTCNTKIHKAISDQEWNKNHPLQRFMAEATKQHRGAPSSPHKCHIQHGEQLCLNITP